jgi:mRNA interferase MazF
MGGRGDEAHDRGGALVAPAQGEVWWAETEDKRRPVLVVTRSAAIPVLTWLVVAPVTRTVRLIPAAIPLGPEEGLSSPCIANFDNLQPIRRSFLTERVGTVSGARSKICRALAALADC